MTIQEAIGYIPQVAYIITLIWCCVCLYAGHRAGKIDLWTTITTTKIHECPGSAAAQMTIVDGKKVAYIGAFVTATCTLALWSITGELTEWFFMAYLATFVAGKWLGDREQRLQAATRGEEQTDRGAKPTK